MEFKNTFVEQQSNFTTFNNVSLSDDCCKLETQNDDPSNLCFRTINSNFRSSDTPPSAKFSTCIPARESLKNSPSLCYLSSKLSILREKISPMGNSLCSTMKITDDSHSFHCMKPSSEALLQVKRKEFDRETGTVQKMGNDFLFVGNPGQVYEDVIISNYIPR